jgi:NTP pyrophosphatase (non-canonical NTP hydrolase)
VETIDSRTYVQESERTESCDFPAILNRISAGHVEGHSTTEGENTPTLMVISATMDRTIQALRDLDSIKKHVFYGKEVDLEKIHSRNVGGAFRSDAMERFSEENIRLFHAGIGMATEAGEVLEQLGGHIFNDKSLDKINLAEEVGDSFWYSAIISRIVGQSFEQIMYRNITKLRARFPLKFTTENALNRNLGTERQILEGHTQ